MILQDNFTVWDPKQLIKKGRERHIFLFEMCLIFAKEVKDHNGKAKYQYKFKLMVSSVLYSVSIFEMCLIFAKEVNDHNGKANYQYEF